jgi:pimeloyl-ACP methyl ester carboxylesterase
VARAAVLRRPDPWASLTLLCSGPAAIPASHQGALGALRAALPAMTLEQVWVLREEMDRQAGVAPAPPDVHGFLHARFVANDPAWLRAKAGILLAEPDRTDALAAELVRSGLRAAVVAGADDDVWLPPLQRQTADRLRAPFHEIAGAGHSPAVDRPDATAAALGQGWLAPHPG